MIDTETFLTALFVDADDFCRSAAPLLRSESRPGPAPALLPGEVLTLVLFARWRRFDSERDFWRWAELRLRGAFPRLPAREQFNRQARLLRPLVELYATGLAGRLGAPQAPRQAMGLSAAPCRHLKRRGGGWLEGSAALGHSNRLDWFQGFQVLAAVCPAGVISGFCFAPATAKGQRLAEDFLRLRHTRAEELGAQAPRSGGAPAAGYYVMDKGFEGRGWQGRCQKALGAGFLCAPKRPRHQARHPRGKGLRRWLASVRQIVETVFDKVQNCFALCRERAHTVQGFGARLAARAALHNFCILVNRRLGRPNLAFADLIDW